MFSKNSRSNLKCTLPALALKKLKYYALFASSFEQVQGYLNILTIYKQASSKPSACSNIRSILFETNKFHHEGPPCSKGPGAIAPPFPPLNTALLDPGSSGEGRSKGMGAGVGDENAESCAVVRPLRTPSRSAQCAARMLLLSKEQMRCCAAGTNGCLDLRRRAFALGGRVSTEWDRCLHRWCCSFSYHSTLLNIFDVCLLSRFCKSKLRSFAGTSRKIKLSLS